jgi:hypothetical protein
MSCSPPPRPARPAPPGSTVVTGGQSPGSGQRGLRPTNQGPAPISPPPKPADSGPSSQPPGGGK